MSYLCIILFIDTDSSTDAHIFPIKKYNTKEESIEYCENTIREYFYMMIDNVTEDDGNYDDNIDYYDERFNFKAQVVSLDTLEVIWTGTF
jgi:hypothetical protein